MDLEQQLLAIERRLWTNDAAFYEQSLVEWALLVFPETGPIGRDVAVAAIRQENAEERRWAEVRFEDIRTLPVSADAALLTYRVEARWEHEAALTHALATSLYVGRDGA